MTVICAQVWFSAQRLKHGVSWTPEEVEEARRKQFNGTVHTVPQTITVIPAHQLSSAANGLQSILQTCQIVGQPGLVFTQVGKERTCVICQKNQHWPAFLPFFEASQFETGKTFTWWCSFFGQAVQTDITFSCSFIYTSGFLNLPYIIMHLLRLKQLKLKLL